MKYFKITIIMTFFIISSLVIGGCSNKPAQCIDISLKDLQTVNKKPNNTEQVQAIRVALSSITSPKESIVYYSDLLKYIEKNTGIPVKVIQRKTYKEVNDLIQNGQVDLAFICTYAYTLGTEQFGLKPFIVPQINGKVTYQSYIIVSADSNIYKFTDLQGKKFAFTDPLSNTGYMYPNYLIKQQKTRADFFFRDITFTYSHDNSVKAVLEKVVDGAAVDGLVFDYIVEKQPDVLKRVRIIKKSAEFGIPPIVVSPSVDAELKNKLKNIFLKMHLDRNGKEILSHLHIEKFLEQDDRKYDTVRLMAGEVLNEK